MTLPPSAAGVESFLTPQGTEATTAPTATTGIGLTNDDLDEMVEVWHNLPDDHPDADLPLCDFLGMTMEEYAVWTRTGIIPAHLGGATKGGEEA